MINIIYCCFYNLVATQTAHGWYIHNYDIGDDLKKSVTTN